MPLSGPPLDEAIDLRSVLGEGLGSKPDEVALVSAEGTCTWRELDDASDRYAAHLIGMGVRAGDRVASLMPNRNALVIHYLACLKAGFVATPLNYRYMPPEIDHALEISGATVMLAHAERDQDLGASELAGRLPLGLIRYGASDGGSPRFEELLQREPPTLELPRPEPGDPAIIFFTSGSTGKPKGVTHSFETYGWLIASAVRAWRSRPTTWFCPVRRSPTSADRRSRWPASRRVPGSCSPGPSMATSCCRCSGTVARPCSACSRQR
jgi:long-chain acyl-CoA synthetase